LARGPRRPFSGKRTLDFEKSPSQRLRDALEDLGRIFSSFGLYMSSRGDLWRAKVCLQLATIPDPSVTTPANVVRRLLNREIDRPPEEVFSAFEAKAFESHLLFESHYARLTDGTEVIVKIIHPDTESQLLDDFDLLPLLKDSFVECGLTVLSFKSAVDDFYHTVQQQMDFVHEARAFKTMALDTEDYDALRVPKVYESLSTSKVLTIERLNGLRLDEVLSSSVAAEIVADGRAALGSVGFERNEFGRLLCEVWLRQALRGRCFPVEPGPANVLVVSGTQIAFTGGAFAALAAEPQANLWSYLLAAGADNSDKACTYLLREMRREGRRVGEDEVEQRFRQAMPFRDGGWDTNTNNQSLAELLFVQWRFASECGYVPLMHLPAFYRGLFKVADSARRLAPHSDSLADGLRDMRLLAGFSQFSKMMTQRHLSNQMDRYAALMVDLPHSLDEALTFGAEGRPRFNLQTNDPTERRGTGASSTVVVALLLVLAAVVLLSHYIKPLVAPGAWSNRINTFVFLLFGALLLRAANRVR